MKMGSNTIRPVALVITRNLPPQVGGMERLVWHIVDELRTDYNVHVVGPTGCSAHLPGNVTATEVPLKPIYWHLLRSKLAALWQAARLRPRVVLAGSGLTAPFAWLAARLTGAHCVVYLHGLDIEARHPVYRLLWRPFFRRCDQVLVNSRFTHQLAREADIAAERIAILHPGVELPDMRDATRQRVAFREKHSLGDVPLMLYVGRITARKGLAVFVREILPRIIERQPNAKLVIVGDEPASAVLNSVGERARVDEILTANGLAQSAVFLGERAQGDPELDAAYFASDVLIFPVQQRANDNEGFGMVAIEAAAHGLPTVAFAAGGVTDAVSHRLSGELITPGDNDAFSQAVIAHLEAPHSARSSQMRKLQDWAADFSWPLFGEGLRRACQPNSNTSP